MTESLIQQTSVTQIKSLYPEIVINLSMNGVNLHGTAEQKSQIINQMRKEGMLKGATDIVLYLPKGITLNLEFKTSKGIQSKEQKEVETRLHNLGHTYYIVRSTKDVFKLISKHTSLDYRTYCLRELIQSLPIKLKDEFMGFPKGTGTTEIIKLVEPYYYL